MHTQKSSTILVKRISVHVKLFEWNFVWFKFKQLFILNTKLSFCANNEKWGSINL